MQSDYCVGKESSRNIHSIHSKYMYVSEFVPHAAGISQDLRN